VIQVEYFWLVLLGVIAVSQAARPRSRITDAPSPPKEEPNKSMPTDSTILKAITTESSDKIEEDVAKKRCDDMIGKFVNGEWIGLETQYDMEKVTKMMEE